ncbi:hypothetical protein ABD91_25935 [Lysinibacillus sphaericus]|uniref:hypothetical protein n=1 Tax=Lysinibacillus sphaericus TaxID=1421 RepID=UPI0018CE11C8|nr:hypothetical protein [Lysinibacillus sphaericus]MBG9694175.1 hypothetical protein [Lysinibacillus sphaericus]
MTQLSTSFVDKYLQRIRENRELKNATMITSTEAKQELDASKIVFIPSSIEGTMPEEDGEGNNALKYDYAIEETVMEMISRKNAFTLNCTIAEGFYDSHILTIADLSYTYDDYNPAAQKGVYIPLSRKKEEPIIILSDIGVSK